MQLCSSLSSQNSLPFSPLVALTQKELQYLLYTYSLYLCLYHCTWVYLYRNHSERQRVAFVSGWALTLKSGDARCLVSPSWVSIPETFPLPIIISHLYLTKRSNLSHPSSPYLALTILYLVIVWTKPVSGYSLISPAQVHTGLCPPSLPPRWILKVLWSHGLSRAYPEDFPSEAKAPCSQCLGSILGQGTRSCLPHAIKILHATIKTWGSQTNNLQKRTDIAITLCLFPILHPLLL